jgi:hypothetical protein
MEFLTFQWNKTDLIGFYHLDIYFQSIGDHRALLSSLRYLSHLNQISASMLQV